VTRVAAGGSAALALAATLLMACGADPSWTPRETRAQSDGGGETRSAGGVDDTVTGPRSPRSLDDGALRRAPPPVPLTRDAEAERASRGGSARAQARDGAERTVSPDGAIPTPTSGGEPVPDGVLLARSLGGSEDPGVVRRYWLYLPPSYDAGRGWPLLLYLHGSSLRGDDLERVRRYGLPWFLDRGEHIPFVVAAPQLPAGRRWVDTARLRELLDSLQATLRIDPQRIYVTGFSMGAGGAWRVAEAMPDRLAAAAPISATTPPPLEASVRALARVPIRAYHGDQDRDASHADAAAMVDAIRAAGGEAELVTLPGEDHDIVNVVYGDSTLYRWLLSHRRDPGRTP
jgi:predicted esterase